MRITIVALFLILFACTQYSTACAQSPLIVDLTVQVLRGLAIGAGEQAGKEIYQRMVPSAPNQETSTPAPQTGGAYPPPSIGDSGEGSPQTVPIKPPVPPDGIRWNILNESGETMILQFYDPSHHVHWPAGERAYRLTSGVPYTIRIRCIPSGQVCYGANAMGKYWGTGLGLRHSCQGCCRTCGSAEYGVAFR